MTQRKPDPIVQWRWRISRALRSRRVTVLDVLVVALLVGCLYGRSWLADLQPTPRHPPPVANLLEIVRHPYADALAATRAAIRLKATVEALGPHKDAAVLALVGVLDRDGNPVRQTMAVMALGEIGPAAAPAVLSLTGLAADNAVNPGLRSLATNALEAVGPAAAAAVPVLVGIVADRGIEATQRKDAADALGAIGPGARRAVSALAVALADPDTQLRSSAAKALQEIGPASAAAVPALIVALGDDDWLVSTAAANAIGDLGPAAEEAVPALIALLQSSENRPGDSMEQVEKFMPMLQDLLPRKEMQTVEKMVDAINRGGARMLVRNSAARALANIGPRARAAVPALGAALQDSDPGVRISAAQALGALGPAASDAVGALTEVLDDENDRVSQAARTALQLIRGAEPGRSTP